jgi:hypothetical protein
MKKKSTKCRKGVESLFLCLRATGETKRGVNTNLKKLPPRTLAGFDLMTHNLSSSVVTNPPGQEKLYLCQPYV